MTAARWWWGICCVVGCFVAGVCAALALGGSPPPWPVAVGAGFLIGMGLGALGPDGGAP